MNPITTSPLGRYDTVAAVPQWHPRGAGVGRDHYDIVVPDIAEATNRAQRNGGAITMPVTDNGWVKKAQVTGPAGNILTLIQG